MKNLLLIIILSIAPLLFASCEEETGNTGADGGKLYLRSIMYIATGKVDLGWYYLGNDGTFVKNPKNGVSPVNITAEKQNNIENTGTYIITGNTIEITWHSGDVSKLALKFKDGEIVEMDVSGIMVRPNGLPKGFTLNATYQGLNNGATYVFESGGAFSSKVYENGQWVNRKGTYSIGGNNLTLRNSDGSGTLCLLALLDDGAIVINTSYYTPL